MNIFIAYIELYSQNSIIKEAIKQLGVSENYTSTNTIRLLNLDILNLNHKLEKM